MEAPGAEESLDRVEAEANALKAYVIWHTTGMFQEVREACGDQGYRAANRIAALKADTDVFTTFKGDSTPSCYRWPKGCCPTFSGSFGT